MGQQLRIQRQNFNGGEIAPALCMRSELDMYPKSCKTLRNFLPTLYGPAKSRPGAIQSRYYNSTAAGREIPFNYSDDTVYRILMLGDGSFHVFDIGGAEPGAAPSNATVFSSEAAVHNYAAADLASIFYYQSGDVIFLYHPSYPVMRIERVAVDDWEIKRHTFSAGPWMEWNTSDTLLAVSVDAYDGAAPYADGDYVHAGGADKTVSLAAYVYWKKEKWYGSWYVYYYLLKLTIGAGHGVVAGDTIIVKGMSGDAEPINGVYEVKKVTEDSVQINTGRSHLSYTNYTNDYPLPGNYGSAKVIIGLGNQFFVSLADSNSGNPLPVAPATETDYWRKTASIDELTITASENLFTANSVGRKVYAELNLAQTLSGIFDAAEASSEWITVPSGTVTLRTDGGVWGGVCALQVSHDGGVTWTSLGEINGMSGKHNEVIARDIDKPNALIRVYMKSYESDLTSKTGCYWLLMVAEGSAWIGEITAYTDEKTVTVRSETSLMGLFQTKKWRLGAISPETGYPACGWVHEERHYVAGIAAVPAKGFASQINNWNTFLPGTLATSSFDFILPSSQNEQILWGVSQSGIVLGTSLSEWQISPRNADGSISFENIKIDRVSSTGSARVQPVLFRDSVFFVGTDRRTVYSIAYVYEKDALLPKKVDILAPHLPEADAVMMCVTSSPEPLIWVLDANGGISALLFDEENNVLGWSRQDFFQPESTYYQAASTDSSPNLNELMFYKSGLTENSEPVLYDTTLTYARWKHATLGTVITLKGNVGSDDPINYFLQKRGDLIVSSAGSTTGNGRYLFFYGPAVYGSVVEPNAWYYTVSAVEEWHVYYSKLQPAWLAVKIDIPSGASTLMYANEKLYGDGSVPTSGWEPINGIRPLPEFTEEAPGEEFMGVGSYSGTVTLAEETGGFNPESIGTPASLFSVRKNGRAYLGICSALTTTGFSNLLLELPLDSAAPLARDFYYNWLDAPTYRRILTELEPTVITQNAEGIEGGSTWKASDLDLFVVNSDGAEVWISGMDDEQWIELACEAGFTGRIRQRLPAHCAQEFRIKLRAADNKRLEVAAFALNLERTNSEVN